MRQVLLPFNTHWFFFPLSISFSSFQNYFSVLQMKEKERLAKEESLRNREMLHKRVESDKLVGQNRF